MTGRIRLTGLEIVVLIFLTATVALIAGTLLL